MRVIFTGRVQGVGFRYQVAELAASFSVTGIVRNVLDGDVELIAEGEKEKLAEFLHQIKNSRLKQNIFKERIEWKPAESDYHRFGIEPT
ncbi:acylphosphatase [Pontiellaceae bacterium B12219]|nr:acylphosphatase [Pontiellaceae bacterium B12219]